jgi:hypothetical protein
MNIPYVVALMCDTDAFFVLTETDCHYRPEILRMSELNDSSELQIYSEAVLYVLSAVTPPQEYVDIILANFLAEIKSTTVSGFATIPSLMFILSLTLPSHGASACKHYQ